MFERIIIGAATAALIVTSGGGIVRADAIGNPEINAPQATHVILAEPVLNSYGWSDFCARNANICAIENVPGQNIALISDTSAALVGGDVATDNPVAPMADFGNSESFLPHLDVPRDAGVAHADMRVPTASSAFVGGPTLVPYGWFDFCGRHPDECHVPKLPPKEIVLTAETWALLNRINAEANKAIIPVSNFAHWGTYLDHWDYPTDGKGDCKVYALYKRKLLMQAGLPRQALLLTIVRDLDNEGHTILTVKTDHGDFVLDNLSSQIRPWDATGYQYLKRQAQTDPNVWLNLGGVRSLSAVASNN